MKVGNDDGGTNLMGGGIDSLVSSGKTQCCSGHQFLPREEEKCLVIRWSQFSYVVI